LSSIPKLVLNFYHEAPTWRLMSDGISYRLGYLNGRVRAYEREEDLKQLVIKSKKLMTSKKDEVPSGLDGKDNKWSLDGPDGKRIIL